MKPREIRMGMGEDPEAPTVREIASALGISEHMVKHALGTALWKVWRACRRLGIDAGDIVGKPKSMTARLEDHS